MKKRLLSLALCLVLVVGLFSPDRERIGRQNRRSEKGLH